MKRTPVQITGLTKKVAARLSYDGSDDPATIYLYNDGCVPGANPAHVRAYLDRLALLMQLKIMPPVTPYSGPGAPPG